MRADVSPIVDHLPGLSKGRQGNFAKVFQIARTVSSACYREWKHYFVIFRILSIEYPVVGV